MVGMRPEERLWGVGRVLFLDLVLDPAGIHSGKTHPTPLSFASLYVHYTSIKTFLKAKK